MHIEAGVVTGAKMLLSYATAVGVVSIMGKLALDNLRNNGVLSLAIKSIAATLIVLFCFQILPHVPVGVSEVHLILGTTVFLVFGVAPAGVGLALALLIQGLLFAPFDLPQYGINVTTLLASLLLLDLAVKRIVSTTTAYKDISYKQILKMSIVWQGAIVSWVAFWAFYGQGFTQENIANVVSFGSAYMSVILLEPLVDLMVLSLVKTLDKRKYTLLFDKRLRSYEAV